MHKNEIKTAMNTIKTRVEKRASRAGTICALYPAHLTNRFCILKINNKYAK